jgi:hypothetical protein
MTGVIPFVRDIIKGATNLVFGNGNEKFTDVVYRNSVTDVIVAIIMLVLWLLLLLLVGKYIFNNVLVKVIPAIKPIGTVWELFLLTILFNILL